MADGSEKNIELPNIPEQGYGVQFEKTPNDKIGIAHSHPATDDDFRQISDPKEVLNLKKC
jgi:hypothetical protein